MGASYTIAKKELKLLFKAKRRIVLFFTVPIMVLAISLLALLIGGIMIATQTNDGPIVITVIDHAQDNNSLYIIDHLNDTSFVIDNKSSVSDPSILLQSNSPPDMLLYFPSNFSTLINNQNETGIFYVYYNNKEIKYEAALSIIDFYSKQLNSNIIKNDYGDLNLNRVNYESKGTGSGVSATQASSIIIIPIYILMFFVIPPISLILISITQEREQKTLESLLLQPISRKSIVNGKILYGLILVASNLIITLATILVVSLAGLYLVSQLIHVDIWPLISSVITTENLLIVLYVITGLTLVCILLISLAVMMSLLAKDEREGNLVVSVLMVLPMVALILIVAVPYNIFGFPGQAIFSSLPVIGFMYSLYITILTGSFGILSILSILAQAIFSLISIWISSRLIEIEGILEINLLQAFKNMLGFS